MRDVTLRPCSFAQEAAVRLNSPELWAAIADLTVSEPTPAELADQVAEMNAAARAASYAAQSRVRLASASAEASSASGVSAPPSGKAAAAVVAGPVRSSIEGKLPTVAAEDERDDAMHDDEADEDDEDVQEGEDDEGEDEEEDDEDEGEGSEVDGSDSDGDDDMGAVGSEDEADEDVVLLPRLPVFEDPASHLLFKRLLHREAAEQPDRPGGGFAGQKRRRDDSAGSAAPADAVLGRLLLTRLAGSLASLATSNRACFVILELLHSSDATVSSGVLSELTASQKALAAQPDCAGKTVLLQALLPRVTLPATATSASASGTTPRATAKTGKAEAVVTPGPEYPLVTSSAKGTARSAAKLPATQTPVPSNSAASSKASVDRPGGSSKKVKSKK